MFTLRSTQFPRILMRKFDNASMGVPYTHENGTLHPVAQARQERILLPLFGLVASLNPGEYHTIAALMGIKVQQIIDLASNEKVNI